MKTVSLELAGRLMQFAPTEALRRQGFAQEPRRPVWIAGELGRFAVEGLKCLGARSERRLVGRELNNRPRAR